MVPAESRKILHNNAVHLPHPHIRHKPLKIIPLEIRAGLAQIAVTVENLHVIMITDKFSAHFQLVIYGLILSVRTVNGKPCIYPHGINLIPLYRCRRLLLLRCPRHIRPPSFPLRSALRNH